MAFAEEVGADRAIALAYRYLNRRERTESEVRDYLAKHDVDPHAVDEALRSLSDQGAVDDSRFARLFIEDKRTLEQWGNGRIGRALRERGIDRDLIEEQLALRPPGEELEHALGLLGARFPVPPRSRPERDRALGVLLRKGFDPELAHAALRAYANAYDQ